MSSELLILTEWKTEGIGRYIFIFFCFINYSFPYIFRVRTHIFLWSNWNSEVHRYQLEWPVKRVFFFLFNLISSKNLVSKGIRITIIPITVVKKKKKKPNPKLNLFKNPGSWEKKIENSCTHPVHIVWIAILPAAGNPIGATNCAGDEE